MGEHLCQRLLFDKVAGLNLYTFLTEHFRAITSKFGYRLINILNPIQKTLSG